MKTARKVHPAADIFPLIEGEAFTALVEDIRENGQREPVLYWRGQLVDGRNRLRVCDQLGIEPDACELDEDDIDDPTPWIISANLHRRHLTESQRAMVAAKLQELYRPEAEARERAGKAADPPVNLPEGGKGESRDKAAAALSVSGKSVSDAAVVIKKGSPELQQAVESGEVSVSKAAKVARQCENKGDQLKEAKAKPQRKQTSPFGHLCKWWNEADAAAQTRFRLWIDGEGVD